MNGRAVEVARRAALAIATHIASVEIDSGYFQETDPQPLFQECSYHWRAPVRWRAVAR